MKVYYDVGNSTDKGRDVAVEICALGNLICEFHAKDGPHMLGKGRIDFRKSAVRWTTWGIAVGCNWRPRIRTG